MRVRVPSRDRLTLAALAVFWFACGQGDLDRDQRGGPGLSLSSAPMSGEAPPAEPPTDLALRLGGQTGSEITEQTISILEGPPACPGTVTRYLRSEPTPLGFAGDAIFARLADADYRWLPAGAAPQSAELTFSSSLDATYHDRTPAADGSCPDALLVPVTLDVSVGGESLAANLRLDIFAASTDSFAGYALLGPEFLLGPLGEASDQRRVLFVLEGTSEQITIWIYRGDVEGELLGLLVAP